MKYLFVIILIGLSVLKSQGQDKEFVGYATALVNSDSILDVSYHGFSNKEQSIKYTNSTIQPIGSVSKTFIGISLMIAQEKGLLNLDEDINTYLNFQIINPFSKKNNKITLRHLASHTSGIIDNKKAYESSYAIGSLEPNMTLENYLKEYLTKNGSKYSKRNFNKANIGTKYEYSNIASGLAALIIEQTSGLPFHLFTRKYIFEPLNMNNTAWFYKDIDQINHAILYNEQDEALPLYSCAIYPDGSLKTTIADLSIYLMELIKGFNKKSKLLTISSWEELYNKHFLDDFLVDNINPIEPNTGVFMVHFKSGMIGHTGSDLGVSAFMMFDPKKNIGKIFMSNEDLIENNLTKFKEIWKGIGR